MISSRVPYSHVCFVCSHSLYLHYTIQSYNSGDNLNLCFQYLKPETFTDAAADTDSSAALEGEQDDEGLYIILTT